MAGFKFANAKVVQTGAEKKKKAAVMADIPDLPSGIIEEYGALSAFATAIKGLLAGREAMIKEKVNKFFAFLGAEKRARPENFKTEDGIVTSGVELRRRTVLESSAVEVLQEMKIPVEEVEEVPETFIINPKYANDMGLLEKLEKLLGKARDLPEDLFLKQTSVKKYAVTDDTLAHCFDKLPAEKLMQVLPLVTTISLKPRVAESDLQIAFEKVLPLLLGKGEEAPAEATEAPAPARRRRAAA